MFEFKDDWCQETPVDGRYVQAYGPKDTVYLDFLDREFCWCAYRAAKRKSRKGEDLTATDLLVIGVYETGYSVGKSEALEEPESWWQRLKHLF